MTEAQANLLARAVSGDAWQSGGGVWLVTLHTGGDFLGTPERFVVFSAEMVCEYASEDAFETSQPPLKTITIENQNSGDRWVIQDAQGHVLYKNAEFRFPPGRVADNNEKRKEKISIQRVQSAMIFSRPTEIGSFPEPASR